MKLLFAAAEAAPFIKTGGLGDVMGTLPRALSEINGNEIAVFLPYYPSVRHNPNFSISYLCHFYMPLAWRNQYVGVFKAKCQNLIYYFIDNEYYFGRDGYGYMDDGERFAFFAKAILEALPCIGFFPDILHCNDWQTGFLPLFLKAFYQKVDAFSRMKTVFTVHNIEYQGKADASFLADVLGVDESWRGVVEMDGLVNAMKTALVLSDRLTTVSRTYAFELHHAYFAHGLSSIIRENAYKMTGIINGIDHALYSPQNDAALPASFGGADLSGKAICKAALQERLGLPTRSDIPIVAIVSRLVPHKGMELIEAVLSSLCESGIQLIVLGTGYREYEDMFRAAEGAYPESVRASITFDADLAKVVYAGADFLLMPSKSEPCGLSQLIAMRYATIPIVRETGGLVDTVPPINPVSGEGYGLTFKSYNAHDMLFAVQRAVALYQDAPLLENIRKRILSAQTDWKESAALYMEVYKDLCPLEHQNL